MKIENVKKGKTIVTVAIGLISFVLAFIIFMQFKFVQNTDITSLKNMREEELREELVALKSKNEEIELQLEETNKKIAEYEENIENYEETDKLINEELRRNKLLLGQTNVYGEGVIIYYEDDGKKVTASDLLKLVNELYKSEAEVISINEQRVVNSTEIVETRESLYINGEAIKSPYIVKAIGNSKVLGNNLSGMETTASTAEKKFSISEYSRVEIPKYDKEQKADNINLK